jgi:hypothetical protein
LAGILVLAEAFLEDGEQPVQHGDVRAAGKVLLSRDNHRALDVGLRRDLFDEGLKLVHDLHGEHVHGATRMSQVRSAMPSSPASN